LDLDEFVDGISKLVCNDQPMDQIRMQKNMNILRNDMKDVLYYVKEVADDIREEVRNGFVRQAQGLPPLEPERLIKPPPKRSCRSYLIDQDGNVRSPIGSGGASHRSSTRGRGTYESELV
jgi:hypothetical protein